MILSSMHHRGWLCNAATVSIIIMVSLIIVSIALHVPLIVNVIVAAAFGFLVVLSVCVAFVVYK